MQTTMNKSFASQFSDVPTAEDFAIAWENQFPGTYCDTSLQRDHHGRAYWIVSTYREIDEGDQFEGWLIAEFND